VSLVAWSSDRGSTLRSARASLRCMVDGPARRR
jgi:hypothetical protein